jgi:LmbE family N-acetylglucosaminyl deacetylase
MIRLEKQIKPNLILLPSTFDMHQDHQVIRQEGFRAFKMLSMIGYESPYNNLTFHTNTFVLFDKKHLERKLKATQCYKSQSNRIYASEDFVRSLAIVRGRQIGTKYYAEAFELIRWII